jgi:hypothetical protein
MSTRFSRRSWLRGLLGGWLGLGAAKQVAATASPLPAAPVPLTRTTATGHPVSMVSYGYDEFGQLTYVTEISWGDKEFHFRH